MAPFIIICETCQARLKVSSASAIGQIMSCPKCESMVQIALPSDAAPADNTTSTAPPVSKPSQPPVETAAGNDFQVVASSLSDEALQQQATDAAAVPPPIIDDNSAQPEGNGDVQDDNAWASEAELSSKRKVLWGSVIAALLLVAIGMVLFLRSDSSPEENTATASDAGVQTNEEKTDPKDIPDETNGNRDVNEEEDPKLDPKANPLPEALSEKAEDNPLKKVDGATPPQNTPKAVTPPGKKGEIATAKEIKPDPAPSKPPNESKIEKGIPDVPVAPAIKQANDLPDVTKLIAMPIERFQVANQKLSSILDDLSAFSGVPIQLDLNSLAVEGLSPNEKISLDLKETTVKGIIDYLLKSKNLHAVNHGMYLSVELKENPVKHVEYDIEDLLPKEQDSSGLDIVKLVKVLVEPTSWEGSGGKGKLELKQNKLSVLQSSVVHQKVLAFLDRLRTARNLSVKSLLPSETISILPMYALAMGKLQKPITYTFFDWTPFDEVRRYLQKTVGLTILVDWESTSKKDVWPSTHIQCSAIKKPLGVALSEALHPLGLEWNVVGESTIWILDREKANRTFEIEFYEPKGLLRKSSDLKLGTNSGKQTFKILKQRIAAKFGNEIAVRSGIFFDQASGKLIIACPQHVHRILNAWNEPVVKE